MPILLQILAPSGVAAVAVKAVLNGTKDRVKNIESLAKETNEGVQFLRDTYHGLNARVFILEEHDREERK